MINISICLIVKNEENRLEKCLQAISAHIKLEGEDELLVVDTGSTDGTINVAKEYAATVKEFQWVNNFSKARNAAMSMAKNNYVLFLDADEYVEDADWKGIKRLIKDYPKYIGQLTRRNICNTSEGGTCISVDLVERIYDKRLYHYEGSVHEQITANNGDTLTAYKIPLVVYHDGYLGTKEELSAKAEKYNALLFEELKEDPNEPYLYYQIAQSYGLCGDKENEYKYYSEGYRLSPNHEASYAAHMIMGALQSMINMAKYDEARELINKELTCYCNLADFLCASGYVYMKCNMFEDAIKMYKSAMKATECHIEGSNTVRPAHNLGCIYEACDDQLNAAKYFSMAIENPESKDRYEKLTNDKEFESKANEKYVSVVVYVGREDISECISSIASQSYGMGHIELVAVFSDDNISSENIDILKRLEAEYENSVMLIKLDKEASEIEAANIALQYCSGAYVAFARSGISYSWNAIRTMNMALNNAPADVFCDDIHYGDNNEFVINLNDGNTRSILLNSKLVRKGYVGKLYRKAVLNNLNINGIVNGNDEIQIANSIFCISNKIVNDIQDI